MGLTHLVCSKSQGIWLVRRIKLRQRQDENFEIEFVLSAAHGIFGYLIGVIREITLVEGQLCASSQILISFHDPERQENLNNRYNVTPLS